MGQAFLDIQYLVPDIGPEGLRDVRLLLLCLRIVEVLATWFEN